MGKSLFEFNSYRKFILAYIKGLPNAGRGEKGRIAQAIECHPAYVSLVLQGNAELSLEQADKLCRHWALNREEQEFFMILVLYERSGTPSLKRFYGDQMRSMIERRSVLKNRLEFRKSISNEDQATYYSAWYFGAIHMLLSIPRFQAVGELAGYLKLPPKTVTRVLEFLVRTGLATQEGTRYGAGTVNIHLGADSPMINKHHSNWRLQCMKVLEQEQPDDLHYSSIVTVSEADIPKIREILVTAIEAARAVVRDSPEEDLFCYTLDLFKVGSY